MENSRAMFSIGTLVRLRVANDNAKIVVMGDVNMVYRANLAGYLPRGRPYGGGGGAHKKLAFPNIFIF